MGKAIVIFLIVLLMGFSVFCYRSRTVYNVDKFEKQNELLREDVRILTHAISIVPKEIKNDVFFNAIKEKFPSVEENPGLIDLLWLNKPKEEDSDQEATQKVKPSLKKSVASIVDSMVP